MLGTNSIKQCATVATGYLRNICDSVTSLLLSLPVNLFSFGRLGTRARKHREALQIISTETTVCNFHIFLRALASIQVFTVSLISSEYPLGGKTRAVYIQVRSFLRKYEFTFTREQKRIFRARESIRLAAICFLRGQCYPFLQQISVLHIYCRGSTLISSVVIIVAFVHDCFLCIWIMRCRRPCLHRRYRRFRLCHCRRRVIAFS